MTGKARDLGAIDAIVVDAREEFAEDYVLPAIQANALYGGGYPLFTALGRPLIAKLGGRARAGAPAATRSPTAAPARATTRCASRRRSRRSTPS